MNNNNINIPQLRFPEFEGEWVEKRLEKLFSEFKSGNNITASQIKENGNYPVYGGNGLRGYYDDFTHNDNYFLIGRQGALCGNINRSNGKAFFSEHAIACRANDENNTEWLAQRLDYYNLNRLSESSAQPGLSVSKLLRFKLTVPTLQEQTKIANFLTSVDKRINLLQKKKIELEQYKKGIMQKLFSQKVRFKDKDGSDFPDWELRQLGEVCEISSSKRVLQKDWKESGIPFYRTREIINLSKGDDFKTPIFIADELYDSIKKKYGIPKTGDILVTGVGSIGETYIVKDIDKFYFKDGNVLWLKISDKMNSNFIEQSFKTRFIKKQLSDNASITTVATFTIEGAKNTNILIPSKEEQTKIANFLSSIDKSIEKLGNQIEQSKDWKKGLLQKMFV